MPPALGELVSSPTVMQGQQHNLWISEWPWTKPRRYRSRYCLHGVCRPSPQIKHDGIVRRLFITAKTQVHSQAINREKIGSRDH